MKNWFLCLGLTGTVLPMLEAVLEVVPVEHLAVHFHDTYGQALVNILVALQVMSPVVFERSKTFHNCSKVSQLNGNKMSSFYMGCMLAKFFWVDYNILIYTHHQELMTSVCSHGGLSLLFMMKVMV